METTIFDHSPWLVSEDRFTVSGDAETIYSLLKDARDCHSFLTLCDNNLNLHFKSVLIKIDANSLQIDKPIEWESKCKGFQLFFKDSADNWNMVKAFLVNEGLYDLTLAMPDNLYHLKGRTNPRVERIEEATVSFLTGSCAVSGLQVVNLSRSGMLVCGRPHDDCLPLDSIINDISITLPDRKFTIPSAHIGEGRIVRTFHCMDSNQTCHGITFTRSGTPDRFALNGILP